MDPTLDSAASGRPNFLTTQWGLVVAGSAEAHAALEEIYRLYCYPVYVLIRRRGHGRQDAQDLTPDFFVHLVAKGTLNRADREQARFRNLREEVARTVPDSADIDEEFRYLRYALRR